MLCNSLFSAAAVGLVSVMTISAAGQMPGRSDAPLPAPNAAVQRSISRALGLSDNADDPRSIALVIQELETLKKSFAGNETELMRQFALAASNLENGERALVLLIFMKILEIDESSIVAALAPYLETEIGSLKSFAGDCIAGIDDGTWQANRPLEPVNYKPFRDYIASQADRNLPVPDPFVRWIFPKNPGQALLAFLHGYEGPRPEQRDVLWAEHVVSDAVWRKENGFAEQFARIQPEAVAELQKLSEHEAWWARLYVAEIIKQHPELRTDEIAARLAADENSLVREAMARE